MVLQAFVPDLYKALGVYLALIVVNCIILGRAEAFASKNSVAASAVDGICQGIGYTVVLLILSAFRELLGAGTLLGIQVMPSSYVPAGMLTLPVGGFLCLGTLIAIMQWALARSEKKNAEKKKRRVSKMAGIIIFIVLVVLALWILASCIRIVPQAYAIVVERLGAYKETWNTGIHFKTPFIDRVARRVNLKEQVVDFAPQPVITKDNVTMRIDTVVFYQITDPKMFCYGVANPIMAIENLTATTLRNIIGDLELDQTLTSRETINTKMRASLDVATDPWGIKVNRVELKNIIPPAAIQDAMEKQMKAERERREAILRAEGEKKSTILVAEGHKESAILDAEAEKQAAILKAEGTERSHDP